MKKTILFSGLALLATTAGLATAQVKPVQAGITVTVYKRVLGDPDKTAIVSYAKGYGIATWRNVETNPQPTNHYLPTDSQWKISQTVKGADGRSWYLVGNNEWASEQYFDLGNEDSHQDLDAVIKIKDQPFRTVVWYGPNDSRDVGGLMLSSNSEYKTYQKLIEGGRLWYQVGLHQWIQGNYADIVSEKSRGQKVFEKLKTEVNTSGNSDALLYGKGWQTVY